MSFDKLEYISNSEEGEHQFPSTARLKTSRLIPTFRPSLSDESSQEYDSHSEIDHENYFIKFIRLPWNGDRFGGNVFPHRLETEFDISEPHYNILINDLSSCYYHYYFQPWREYILLNRFIYISLMMVGILCIVFYLFLIFLKELKWLNISWKVMYLVIPPFHLLWIVPILIIIFWRTILPLLNNYRGNLLQQAEKHMLPHIEKANSSTGVFRGILKIESILLPPSLDYYKNINQSNQVHNKYKIQNKQNKQNLNNKFESQNINRLAEDDDMRNLDSELDSSFSNNLVELNEINFEEHSLHSNQLNEINNDALNENPITIPPINLEAINNTIEQENINHVHLQDHATKAMEQWKKFTLKQRIGQMLLSFLNEIFSENIFLPHLIIYRPNDSILSDYKTSRIKRYMKDI